jgi:hypothetical protein
MLFNDEIETFNASTIGVVQNSKYVDIYIRTNDEMLTITERKENLVVYLKMLKSMHSQLFELYIGDHYEKKYRVRLPLKNLELIAKELQPLIDGLDINQSSRTS